MPRGSQNTIILFLFASLLSHFWLIHFSHTPALSNISRPLSSYMCSIKPETAKVGSSFSHMRGPGIGCWFSDRSNCSHWSFEAAVLPIISIFTLTSESLSLYTTLLLLYWFLYNYAAHADEVCTVAAAIASTSIGDAPVGYSTFHVDLASYAQS